MKNAYEMLTDHYRKVGDLRHVYSITSWDEAAMMPVGGGTARGEALATLDVVIHEMVVDGPVGDWLDACSNLDLDDWQRANVREIRREYEEMSCLPSEFVSRVSIARSNCEQAWRTLREQNDWHSLTPLLETVVDCAREEAVIRAGKTGLSPYDAMLECYEPGMTSSRLDELFGDLKLFLPGFIDEVLARQAEQPLKPLGDYFPVSQQREIGLKVMKSLGFDFDHGRLDISHHPFCGGVQEDVRITTRYTTDNFVESLMAVIHETGHAMYEQGRPAGFKGQPVSNARSSGVHESQSLLMEMQAGRSREFVSFLGPLVREAFDRDVSDQAWQDQNLYRLLTNVERGYIRVDADEVTYPLHVILRYEIEKDLIEGRLDVADIPDRWDAAMMDYLKVDTRGNYRNGCMQDVHWSASLFGYFPTYTLGAMMAAQFFAKARGALPDLSGQMAAGDFSSLVAWLRENIHSKGSLLTVDELLESATGEVLNPGHFIAHLQQRYLP